MKITIEVPTELADLIHEAVDSGSYESAQQVALDGLYLWADAVENGERDADEEDDVDEDLLAAMEQRGRERG
jgi:Arc/MetJ-type ribon-helix-helix transcriptional regulator